MIHYLYSTRGSYLYLVGKYNNKPKTTTGQFVLSVPEKTPQLQIDSLAHRRFMEHLRRPRKVNHDRHVKSTGDTVVHIEKELAVV